MAGVAGDADQPALDLAAGLAVSTMYFHVFGIPKTWTRAAVVRYSQLIARSTDPDRSRRNDLQSGSFELSKVPWIGGRQGGSASESNGGNHTIDKRSAPTAGNIE